MPVLNKVGLLFLISWFIWDNAYEKMKQTNKRTPKHLITNLNKDYHYNGRSVNAFGTALTLTDVVGTGMGLSLYWELRHFNEPFSF